MRPVVSEIKCILLDWSMEYSLSG